MSFINEFLDYTKSYESPDAFWYWAAVGIIGAVLRDNCYLLLGDTRIYPNLYIIIIAKNLDICKYSIANVCISFFTPCDKCLQTRSQVQKFAGNYRP